MKSTNTLTLVAFASLALNVFLGGVLAGKVIEGDSSEVAETKTTSLTKESAPPAKGEGDRLSRPPSSHQQPNVAGQPRHHPGDHPRPRGDRGRPKGGPSDLALLRQMIQIMGGPQDPRITSLRAQRKGEISRIKDEMSAAHQRVHEALTAEKPNDAQLREALKNLRKTAFEAQARAQEGILTLAELMTDEERARLRDHRHEKRRRRDKPAPRLKKNSP